MDAETLLTILMAADPKSEVLLLIDEDFYTVGKVDVRPLDEVITIEPKRC